MPLTYKGRPVGRPLYITFIPYSCQIYRVIVYLTLIWQHYKEDYRNRPGT